MKNGLRRPHRSAFRRKWWQLIIMMLAFATANAQSDSTRYTPINSYGVKYKRHTVDSVLLMPLYNSPHTPYRAGALKYRESDSSLYKWTGTQWLKVQEGGTSTTGIDTVYTQDDTVQVIVTPGETYYTIVNSPYTEVIDDNTIVIGNDTLTVNGVLNTNTGSGYRFVIPSTQQIKTFTPSFGLLLDSTINNGSITGQVDSFSVLTRGYGQYKIDSLAAEVSGNISNNTWWGLDGDDNLTNKTFSGDRVIVNKHLQVSDSGFVAIGTVNGTHPIPSTSGRLFFWHPGKAALRAGSWFSPIPDASIGNLSVAFGSASAMGAYSFAAGDGVGALGDQSVALGGASNNAYGNNSLVAGAGSSALGNASISLGYGVVSEGQGSLATGYFTAARNGAASAFGSSSEALGRSSAAFGEISRALGRNSFTAGYITTTNTTDRIPQFSIGWGTDTSRGSELFRIGWRPDGINSINIFSVDTLGQTKIAHLQTGGADDSVVVWSSSDSLLKMVPRSEFANGGVSGISEVVADYGLINVNDSTLKVDTLKIVDWKRLYKAIDSLAALGGGGSGSPGGSATEMQYRSGASTFGGAAGTSWDNTNRLFTLEKALDATQSLSGGWLLKNPTSATSGNQKISPALWLEGNGFETTGSTSQSVRMGFDVLPVQGSTTYGTLRLLQSINGGTISTPMTFATGTNIMTLAGSPTVGRLNLTSDGSSYVQRFSNVFNIVGHNGISSRSGGTMTVYSGTTTVDPIGYSNAFFNVIRTTLPQIAAVYDASNYTTFGTSSSGILTIAPSGGLSNFTGRLRVSALDTDGSAPTTSGTTKMVITDGNGELSFADIPSGGGSSPYIYQFISTQQVTVTNTTTETTIYGTGEGSAGIDGSANITTGTQIVLKGAGEINTDASSAPTLQLNFKTPTSTVTFNISDLATGLNQSPYTYEYKLIPLGTGTSQSYIWQFDFYCENNLNPIVYKFGGRETSALTTTGTVTIDVTVEWSAADDDNTLVANYNTIEIFKK